jgi:hypothetical protein
MPKIRSRLLLELVAATAVVAMITGCSGGGSSDTVKVTGVIKYNGAAVAGAAVSFSPTGSGNAAAGRTDKEGKFTLTTFESEDGALPGDYTVTVSKAPVEQTSTVQVTAEDPGAAYAAAEARGADLSGSGEVRPGAVAADTAPQDLLPVKYKKVETSGLSAKVEKGKENHFEFDLTD